jgi:phosphoglucosamine mutase
VQSNLGLDAALASAGGRVERTSVGDRYVAEAMLRGGFTLGGENSGHVICADVSMSGDGLVAALLALQVMLDTGRPLSELRRQVRLFPQLTRNLKVREKKPLETLPRYLAAAAEVEGRLAGRGRLLVRYSGTEPKLRLLVESDSDASNEAALAALEVALRSDLEVL